MDPGGYSVAMPVEASETLFSATTLLWIVVSVMAAIFLLGSINRRRSRLTESLRGYVDQKQDGREAVSGPDKPSED
jgi:beta-lactamase regulating signal transducer with metallopeptidase domain